MVAHTESQLLSRHSCSRLLAVERTHILEYFFIFFHFLFTCPTSPSQPCVWLPDDLSAFIHSQLRHLNKILLPTMKSDSHTHTHTEGWVFFLQWSIPLLQLLLLAKQISGTPSTPPFLMALPLLDAQGWVNLLGMPVAAFPQLAFPNPKPFTF